MNLKTFMFICIFVACHTAGNICTSLGDRLLTDAVRANDINAVNQLLAAGAIQDKESGNALMAAIYHANNDILKLLLDHCANPNYMKSDEIVGQSDEDRYCAGHTLLTLAVVKENKYAIEALLKAGARGNVKTKHGYALTIAVEKDTALVEILLKI
jgi:ankyrin repeat protein